MCSLRRSSWGLLLALLLNVLLLGSFSEDAAAASSSAFSFSRTSSWVVRNAWVVEVDISMPGVLVWLDE